MLADGQVCHHRRARRTWGGTTGLGRQYGLSGLARAVRIPWIGRITRGSGVPGAGRGATRCQEREQQATEDRGKCTCQTSLHAILQAGYSVA
ncbi:MAG TPA: hypothetical protein VFN35_22495 [Ktedonobacteraceae bacterium]|nr:hypothetical protein [Ktedonobacteraceae bacterium]